MPITPEERAQIEAGVTEIGAAIEDRINATTAAQRTAAITRFRVGFRDYSIGLLNLIRHGISGDY